MVQESSESVGHRNQVDQVLHTISNPIRRTTITCLGEGGMRFSQLLAACGLDYDHDAGHFAYHLSELMKRTIVEKKGDLYLLTSFGLKVAETVGFLEKACSNLFKVEQTSGGRKGLDVSDLDVEWFGSGKEVRVDRKTEEGNLSVAFNTKPNTLLKRLQEKLPESPERDRLITFLAETDKWGGPQRVLTKRKDVPLGWAIVGSETSSEDKPCKQTGKVEVLVKTALRIDHIGIWAITPQTNVDRKKVASGLLNAILAKAKEIRADAVKVDGANADDKSLIEALREAGFERVGTNYSMQKSLR